MPPRGQCNTNCIRLFGFGFLGIEIEIEIDFFKTIARRVIGCADEGSASMKRNTKIPIGPCITDHCPYKPSDIFI